MRRLELVAFVFLLSACATTQSFFLTDPNNPVLERQSFVPLDSVQYNFNSAKSVQEKSRVEIGGWQIMVDHKQQAFRFAVKIVNISDAPCTAPEDIVVVDGDKKSLKLLEPDEYIYYIEGMAAVNNAADLSGSASTSVYADHLRSSHGYSGQINSYRTLYTHFYSSYDAVHRPYPSYPYDYYYDYVFGPARRELPRVNGKVREAELTALKPSLTMPQASNAGRVYCLGGKLPIEVHVFACGDHHIITLDRQPLPEEPAQK